MMIRNPVQASCLFFIIIGIFFRADYFIENRSLRVDEAAYFDCLVSKTPQEVLLNKNYNFYSPPAPIGFSFIEKLFINLFGCSEYVLRFIPLIFSLYGILLFYFLISQYSLSWGTPLAMGLFALSDRLIFFSADMHPYSTEVFFAVLALWMFNRLESKKFHPKEIIYFMLTAVISVWFSYTVVFILTGITITSLYEAIFQKQWETLRKLLIIHCSWVISFLFVYTYTIHPILQTGITYNMWEGYFIKGPQGILSNVQWVLKAFWDFFRNPLGIIPPLSGIFLFLVGIGHLFYINKRQLFLILSPLFLTLGAALFKKYPFTGRTVLFLMPNLLILLSLGVSAIMGYCKGKIKPYWLMLAFIFLLIPPLIKTLDHFVYSWGNEEAREAVCYLKNNILAQDIVLMNNEARFSYGYYMGYFHIDMKDHWVGRIWDKLFKETGDRPNARCIFEHLRSDPHGFFIGTSYNKNRPVYKIYSDQWLKIENKREWLLLIDPSEDLRKFLKMSLYNGQRTVKEARFKGVYLYLLEKQ